MVSIREKSKKSLNPLWQKRMSNINQTQKISKEKWDAGHALLTDVGQVRLIKHTVVICNSERPFGTCVLLKHQEKKYFLTAAHVALKISQNGYEQIGVAIKPDDIYRSYPLHPSEAFQPRFWDPEFREEHLKNDFKCKDLALIEIPVFMESIISAVKEFVKLPDDSSQNLAIPTTCFGQGLTKKGVLFQMNTFGFVLEELIEENGVDYYIAKSMEKTYGTKHLNESPVCDFRGYSGGGIFVMKEDTTKLIGIAFYQDPKLLNGNDGYVSVTFHGPKSLKAFLSS